MERKQTNVKILLPLWTDGLHHDMLFEKLTINSFCNCLLLHHIFFSKRLGVGGGGEVNG